MDRLGFIIASFGLMVMAGVLLIGALLFAPMPVMRLVAGSFLDSIRWSYGLRHDLLGLNKKGTP